METTLASPVAKPDIDAPAWLAEDARPLDWNGPTSRPFIRIPIEDLDRPVIELVERVTRRQPERTALTDAETSLTYAQLWDGLGGLAETIAEATRPGELVALVLPATAMFPLAMLACLAAGRPFLALDASAAREWLGQALEDARPALIVGDGDAAPSEVRVIPLDHPPAPLSASWRPAALGSDEPACVLFTSGSTGRPKGMVNSQRALLQRVAQSINAAHINAEDRLLTLASPGTIVGVRDALTALVAGASLHLVDPARLGARQVLDALRAEAVTILFAFPALLRSVLAQSFVRSSSERAGPALRLVRIGGDVTLWSDIERLRAWLGPKAAIQLVYAATEAPMLQWFVDDACSGEDPRIPIGYPLQGNRLAVIHRFGRAARPGEAGELMVESPYVALGLWTAGRCVAGGFETGEAPGSRCFLTGDLVRQRPDGLLERLGRKDRQVKIRGVRVELDGVEAALRQHPKVRDVAALARPSNGNGDGDGGPSLVAYVCADEADSEGLLAELKALMRAAPAAMRPGRLYLVPQIPRLASSKLDVRALAALDRASAQTGRGEAKAAVPASTEGDPALRTVARLWREALQAPAPGPDDDFFDAGGDSLKAVTFTLELERALGLQLPLTLINETPRFADLCQTLTAHRTRGYAPLVLLKAGDGRAPLFFVHGVGGNVAELFPVARALTWPGAVYGLQARGLARRQRPHRSVGAMATEYLDAIRARQPEGPYLLCGYSFGGLVAFEMARRLKASGDEVGLLALFDTSPWFPGRWLGAAGRRLARLLTGKLQPHQHGPTLFEVLTSAPAGVLKVMIGGLVASALYHPGVYPGQLTLFTPQDRDPAPPSPRALWTRHAASLSVTEIPGAHLTMLAPPHAQAAAAALAQSLPGTSPLTLVIPDGPPGPIRDPVGRRKKRLGPGSPLRSGRDDMEG